MLRNNKTSTSMQKTYDECYLICSTAVYFEGQNNEEEALRSWRSALDRIYYHNAYKVAPNYQAASATEKALQDSLREMELQCKERVSLLEALKKSREEAADKSEDGKLRKTDPKASRPLPKIPSDSAVHQQSSQQQQQQQGSFPGWIGGGTVPSVSYEDIPGPNQAAVKRPSASKSRSSDQSSSRPKLPSSSRTASSTSQLTPRAGSGDARESSRTPSPEKKTSMLRTTLRADRNGKKPGKPKETLRSKPPSAGIKAAGLAWDTKKTPVSRPDSASGNYPSSSENTRRSSADAPPRSSRPARPLSPPAAPTVAEHRKTQKYVNGSASEPQPPPRPPKHGLAAQQILQQHKANSSSSRATPPSPQPAVGYTKPPPDFLKYRSEYPATEPISQAAISASVNPPKFARPTIDDEPEGEDEEELPVRPKKAPPPPPLSRRPVSRPAAPPSSTKPSQGASSSVPPKPPAARKKKATPPASKITTPPSSDESEEAPEPSLESSDWRERLAYVKKHLPKGVDEGAAKSIFNEIVVEGDEVHWDDVAGLDAAKTALKEAVVYPFLRPDLFMGLREPARGMLLFGPPGTGKTMLARAVATESRSTFFAISASSLTSKWMGESEKLVRALFQLAKALAPSIIFVDEIDSLLSSRGDGEHETTRRIKTEFLIQWSDLQRAAAGKEAKGSGEGDATRVLVLAATNLPWAIDEAARRRFVRRQYIPLPEAHVREQQLRTLLSHQKQTLSKNDIKVLVEVTDGYSGSDITALAKDAAMGPLRSLGESLLHMSPDEIRPIAFDDFEASLINIRPSVSKQGLKEFEDWAREFGERAG